MGLSILASPHILCSAAYVRGYRDSVFQTHGAWGSLSLHPPHILRSAVYVRGYGDSVFQTHGIMGALSSHPRTYSAPLRMYVATEIASSRRMGAWVSLSLHPPHILRSAVYVRGYRDSVFQTHGVMGLSIIASPRTNSAPLCMYGVTEIASSRRMGLLDSISKFFIPHSSFIIFNFNLLCPVKNQYICKNKLNVKR